jgi:tetratricopeptide (TPR) repeat protein
MPASDTILSPRSASRGNLDLLREGLEHQRAGRGEEAACCYRRILAVDPDNADAWHLSGMLALEAGREDAALAAIAKSIELRPEVAPFHNNLGMVLQTLGRPEQSVLCFEHALRLAPGYPEAHVNLGNALQQLGRYDEAAAHCKRAIELNPRCAEAWNNLGNALLAVGRAEEAAEALRRAIHLRPGYAEAQVNLASVLKSLERFEEAAACCREAIRIQPGFAEAYGNLGAILLNCDRLEEAEACVGEALRLKPGLPEPYVVRAVILQRGGRPGEAEAACRQALALRPGYAEAFNNLGNALEERGCVEQAAACYREAIRLKPALADAHYNLGNTLRAGLRLEEACACFGTAIRSKPGHAGAHWNRALTRLLAGDFERGWEEFEWRWRRKKTPPRRLPQPLWDSSPLDGRRILLHAEQGLGDTIQFLRYSPLVRRAGGRVIVECQPPLAELARTAAGVDEVVEAGSRLPGFEVHAPLLSLPRLLGTGRENIPARVPYLSVAGAYRETWRKRLAPDGRRRVGLVWAGNPNHADDRRRSVSLDAFAPLGSVEGVRWYGLQHGPCACEAQSPPAGLELEDLSRETADFRDLAAAMLELDLVISVDTSAAHLAGALARPVWVLLPYLPDWRWLTAREDSPWYPTMRLFRQPRPGDWAAVFERVREALELPAERPI